MKKVLKYIAILVICCLVFFLIGEPFRIFFKLTEETEVRPVCAFPLLFGIAFGFCGTLGCAFGNLISDIIDGYSLNTLIWGGIIQILYGYLPVLIFNHLRRHDENKFQLDRVYKIVQYLVICFVDSIFAGILVHFPELKLGFINIFLNQFIFFVVIGIPFFLIVSIRKQRYENRIIKNRNYILFSINEKLILFLLSFSILIAILSSVVSYYYLRIKFEDNQLLLWTYVYLVCGAVLFFCLISSILFIYYMEKTVSKPLERLSTTAKNFGKETDIHLEIAKILMKCEKYLYFSTEIGNLARSYNFMANELENYIENLSQINAEKEKNNTQLRIATEIQLGALPKPKSFDKIELFATTKPALDVGGDFYDFFEIDDDKIAVVIADVSGKGIPASLFMMASKIILKGKLKAGLSPAEAMTKANRELCETNPAEMFVTCFCGVLNLTTNIFTYSNAGHEKPFISRNGSDFEIENINSGFVLGGLDSIKYKQADIQLHSGDIVFTYTDGIPEAMSPTNEEFGNERIKEILDKSKNKSMKEMTDEMYNAISVFNDTAGQFDDITMLMFKIK